jgi:DNA polymerase-3 subunit epsilon
MTKRQLIVVDIETTGLVKGYHQILEVAAVNAYTGKALHFVPALFPGALDNAEGQAMKINRYFERGVYEERLDQAATADGFAKLQNMLHGNSFGGMNPMFDWEFLMEDKRGQNILTPGSWHYAPADLGMYACSFLGIDPAECPSLNGKDGILDRLGIETDCAHGALGDAVATAAAFNKIRELTRGRAS